jgi:hypothetical protein
MAIEQSKKQKECFISPKIPDGARASFRATVCKDLPIIEYEDENYYCVLHLPDEKKHKNTNFWEVFDKRLNQQENDFSYIYFSDSLELRNHTFSTEASFSYAIFTQYVWLNVTFNETVHFLGATFIKKVIVISTFFEKSVNFGNAEFLEDFSFLHSNFINENSHINLCGATFSEDSHVYITDSDIRRNLYLKDTKLKGYLTFSASPYVPDNLVFNGESVVIDLQEAKIEKPERVSFYSVRLRPSWFINTESRKFVFTNVKWENNNDNKQTFNIDGDLRTFNLNEIKNLEEVRKIPNAKSLLIIAYRQLAENAENNNRFEEASNFRRMAFETEWLEKKEKISNWIKNLVPESEKLKRRFSGSINEEDKPIPPTNSFGILRRSGDFFIHGLYRITSFYGESWSWALGVLLSLILVIFPIIYTQINFQTCSKDRPIATSLTICESKDEETRKKCTCSTDQITFSDAIVQSLTTATLQNVEYRKPLTVCGELWIILEKIFAPLQAALLALAIRRKFMR